MKLIISILLLLSSFTTANAENIFLKIQSHGYFNHIEGAFTAGTTGLGFDLGFPLQEWGRLRIGGVWRPRGHYSDEYAVHIDDENQWGKFSAIMSTFVGVQPEKYVSMEGKSSMNNFKLLVDIFPIKKHRNFHVTVGFFVGNSTIVEATNTSIASNTVAAIKSYNTIRQKAINHENIDLSVFGLKPSKSDIELIYKKLIEMGEITIPLGEKTDENGNKTVVNATINDKDVIEISAKVNSFKPYIGAGYELPITKDKRTKIGIDAGILIWGGKPKVEVFEGLSNVAGHNTEGYLKSADRYPVFPEASIRISQRIW